MIEWGVVPKRMLGEMEVTGKLSFNTLSFRLFWILPFKVPHVMLVASFLETLDYLGLMSSDTRMITKSKCNLETLTYSIPFLHQNEFH